jgi:hypothetical protein
LTEDAVQDPGFVHAVAVDAARRRDLAVERAQEAYSVGVKATLTAMANTRAVIAAAAAEALVRERALARDVDSAVVTVLDVEVPPEAPEAS